MPNKTRENMLGFVLWDRGRLDEAMAMFREAIDQDPAAQLPRLNMYWLSIWRGRTEEALAVLVEAHDTSMLGQAIARARRDPRARASAIRQLASTPPRLRGFEGHVLAAELYGYLGESEAALAELERALAEQSPELEGLKSDPFLTSLRRHPRFTAIARKVGLQE